MQEAGRESRLGRLPEISSMLCEGHTMKYPGYTGRQPPQAEQPGILSVRPHAAVSQAAYARMFQVLFLPFAGFCCDFQRRQRHSGAGLRISRLAGRARASMH